MPKSGNSTVIGGRVNRSTPLEKAEEEDRLSELPDCLLLLILSFLPTKQVVKTCLLSRRWQFLWTYMSEVDLVEDTCIDANTPRFVDCVGRMLVMYRGIYLNKFAVSFFYDKSFASNVDIWVQFAIKNKVKDITLRCLHGCFYYYISFYNYKLPISDYFYMLPQMLCSNSSMTGLTIYCCDVAPQTVVAWGSLKSLSIGGVILQDSVMENILSGCPVLEVLCLTEFWGLNYLNISSQNLKKLVIEQWNGSLLEISAPYVLDLSISIDIADEAGYFRLKDISSVVRAKLYFEQSGLFEKHDDPRSFMNYMKELLESIKSAFKFIQDDLPGEPMLTMAQILLKRSRVLEKMVIAAYEGSRDLAEIAIKVLTFPRASPEAVVMVDK